MRVKMDRQKRAKQFMPFAALKGYEEALRAKEKRLVPRIELSEEIMEELDECMRRLQRFDLVKIVHYSKGEYLETVGVLAKIDKDSRTLTVVDKKITFDNIYRMEILKEQGNV